jgi:nucleoside-diphosphate-sugar epimerase
LIIAITGGTGFIGKKLVLKHLENGDEVRIFSRRDPRDPRDADLPATIKWFQGDLGLSDNMDSFVDKADILYHCAGEIRDESCMEAVHLHGTSLLIQASTGKIGRWVQLSSVGAYGLKQDGMVNESSTLNPLGMYEVTKAKSDELVVAASSMGSFEYVILRPSIVYGAGMSNRSLFSLISAIKKGFFVFIGKPGASANYVHVDNVVEALFLCGNNHNARGQIYNISDYRTLEEFVGIISSLLRKKVPVLRLAELPMRFLIKCIEWIPKFPLTKSRIDALTNKAHYPIDKIKNDLSYEHVVSMEEGLAEMVNTLKH